MSPSTIRLVTMAASSRSPRCLGKIEPRDGAPTEWPARPMRCSPRLTAPGDSTWTTRSTAPMSMPSSSDDVATMAAQLAALQLVLDDDTLLAGERAVVGHHERARSDRVLVGLAALLVVQLVQLGGEALGGPATVAEDDRGAVGQDAGEDLGIDARPDRTAPLGERGRRRPRRELDRDLAELRHVLDRDDDFDLQRLADAGVDDRHRPLHTRPRVAAEELGDLLQRALRGRQADPLRRAFGDEFEPFQRECQVGAALGRGHGVDLVDDHGLDAGERVAGRRREHQVQRLGRGDQQVGRAPDQLLAVVGRRVARAHRHVGGDERFAQPFGRQLDPLERSPEVLLDVERQRPQRGDVEHARAARHDLRDAAWW